ncbi:nuclear transport factor 2 family protein [Superficieibacter electus]|uniref:Nuclear transport factor 2 family protein n=1 Tax=Superficieibacter electus TaxID=2022662 RepID=A0A2P5GVS0_9ENTR|nr:nuclear transport factor 2 family protein [Superficieibacter electus]POP47643.1 nuclear transport factor 2 family protein [Superficieibacter electus]POP50654.1 nuclear transport factor 2 family protein [Superficieibacter electus]
MHSQNETELVRILQAERDIIRLINSYPYLLDSGKFEKVAELLRYATLEAPGHQVTGRDEIKKFLTSGIQRHQDGTPRTWHAVSNILIEGYPLSGEASTSSYFIVHQELPGFPLQPICTGHYKDRFALIDGEWQFVHRAVVPHLIGDLRFHVSGTNAEANL